MTTIFISYRRDDAAAYAGRLYDGLRERYGDNNVFMDVDRIQPGENFAAVIERSVHTADVVLAVIGKSWLTVRNESEQRRLDDPEDFVRMEIKATLDAGRRLIPVLVGGATMPGDSSLPTALQRLAGLQAVNMSDERWDYDSERLTSAIDGSAQPSARRAWFWLGGALALAAVALALMMTMPKPPTTSPTSATATVALRAAPAALSGDQARAMVAQRDFYHARWNAAATATHPELTREVIGTDIVIKSARYQLMWQQRASPQPLDRNSAQQYVQDLNTRKFASYTDWRLPTLEEAMSLMGSGATEDCRLHKLFDRSGPIMRTADTADGDRDWVVYFCDGITTPEVAGFSAQVRAVRGLR